MAKKKSSSYIAVLIIVLIGAGFAAAGSTGPTRILGLPIFSFAVCLAFVIQWLVFVPSYLGRTEKFFDLTGGITYLTVIITGFLLAPEADARSIILVILVSLWAIRLATFLYLRIHRSGKDERFDDIKTSFSSFLVAWTLQGLWVTFTIAAALAAITTPVKQELGWLAYLGLFVWLVGFTIEAVADAQKSAFKSDPENKGKFINTGLWAKSRHPNYFGEIVLWIGVAMIAFPVLQGWQYVTLVSPVFVALLLIKVSGIPMLEKRAERTWGAQPDYRAYKENTPALIPKL